MFELVDKATGKVIARSKRAAFGRTSQTEGRFFDCIVKDDIRVPAGTAFYIRVGNLRTVDTYTYKDFKSEQWDLIINFDYWSEGRGSLRRWQSSIRSQTACRSSR